MTKFPYILIDSHTGMILCRYRALTIALRDCAVKNASWRANLSDDPRYFVERPNGSRVTA